MFQKKIKAPAPVKEKLHPENKHRNRYDFKELLRVCPELEPFLTLNLHQEQTIDFANPAAVKLLNKALLRLHYGIDYWDIPEGYLCPPIPGRADYLHHIADWLGKFNEGKAPTGPGVRCLDIGLGANAVYPIIGNKTYGWSFVGSDIDAVAIESAQKIIAADPGLSVAVECRLQANPQHIFEGIIRTGELFDLSICNPPFHASAEAATSGTLRKLSNLKAQKVRQPVLNFGGQHHELCCEGGEAGFIERMVQQSQRFGNSCCWFSTLVSKQSNLKRVLAQLEKAGAITVQTIPMGQGNKTSRIVVWTFLSRKKQKLWAVERWGQAAAQ